MIRIEGANFIDEEGRTLMLRGVNLGGSSKMPYTPMQYSHVKEGFLDIHKKISFVGRPFPLAEADSHFKRLQQWGFNTLRLITTWEAIAPHAPDQYDEAYLDYLHDLVRKAGEYGFWIFIDPHQDVWSRFSGGDGAPAWTFEAAGLDIDHFHETGAALVHNLYGDPFPRMAWTTNYGKLACATMFTLFFGGRTFAPSLKVGDQNIQDFLQGHFIAAMQQVAQRLQGLPQVIGYDTFNEPSAGWIGHSNLLQNDFPVKKGVILSPFEAMVAGSGHSLEVPLWDFGLLGAKKVDITTLNPKGLKAWMSGKKCVWKQHGVWEDNAQGQPVLLNPTYFSTVNGQPVNFIQQYFLPFIERYAQAIRSIDPQAIIFLEPPVLQAPPQIDSKTLPNVVNASHWYDAMTLFTKKYNPWLGYSFKDKKMLLGKAAILRSFIDQMNHLKQESAHLLHQAPTLLGEVGIPMDMHEGKAYKTGNFKRQNLALDRTMQAIEANLLHFTWWNYTADNTNERGDQWNGEDLSIFSPDQQKNPADLNSGGRALEALLRPYPVATAGKPVLLEYNWKTKVFRFTFEHHTTARAYTEIYVPTFQYPKGVVVTLTDGSYQIEKETQRLVYFHTSEVSQHTITIHPQ